jgi:hypothetical protein
VRFALVVAVAGVLLAGTGSPAASQVRRPPCATAGTANGRYVAFLYEEILGRCPDSVGRRHWEDQLNRGVSRWTVAEALDMSTENLGRNNVDVLYQGLLNRAPTPTERASWITYLRGAHANAVPTAALLASDEGYALHTTGPGVATRDQEWLTYAYNRILDRAPDPQGEAYYLGRLGAAGSTRATRNAVAMSLEHSAPNADSWVRAAMTEALGRTPDSGGIRYWTAWLTGPGHWQTFRLWTHLLSSDEAFRLAQTPS